MYTQIVNAIIFANKMHMKKINWSVTAEIG